MKTRNATTEMSPFSPQSGSEWNTCASMRRDSFSKMMKFGLRRVPLVRLREKVPSAVATVLDINVNNQEATIMRVFLWFKIQISMERSSVASKFPWEDKTTVTRDCRTDKEERPSIISTLEERRLVQMVRTIVEQIKILFV